MNPTANNSGDCPEKSKPAKSSSFRGFIAGGASVGLVLLAIFLWKEVRDRQWRQIPDELVWDSVTNSSLASLRKDTAVLNEWLAKPRNAQSQSGQFYQSLIDLHSDSQLRRDNAMKNLSELGFKRHLPSQVIFSEAARIAAKDESGPAKTNLLRVGETFLFDAARANSSLAQLLLGRRYAGNDTPSSFPLDKQEALRWFFVAGKAGIAAARLRTIEMLAESGTNRIALDSTEMKSVMQWAKDFEKQENLTAIYFVGLQMLNTSQNPRDRQKALQQVEKAAIKGDVRAIHAVATILMNGLVGKPNPQRAYMNYLAAAQKGYLPSQVALGKWFYFGSEDDSSRKPDYAKALEWFEKPANADDPEAQYYFAVLLLTREKTAPRARSYFESAAAAGNPQAMLYLAMVLEKEAKTADDYTRVIELYNAAAGAGLARAHYALGNIMQSGLIEGHGAERAAYHFRIAAMNNYAPAQYALAKAYATGNGVPESSVESVRWLERAAENFSDDACVSLANAYQTGEGVITNDVKVAEYRNKADSFAVLRRAKNPFRIP